MNLFIRKATMLFIVIMGVALINYPVMATDVGGIIDTDTTWNLGGSPYIVTGGILVNSGVTLTIEPGVQVRFNGYYSLIVEGNIRALGTQGTEILFTSNLNPQQIEDWDKIELTDNIGSEIRGIIMEYSANGIWIKQGSDNTISNSVLRNNESELYSNGTDNLFVHNNHIYDSRGAFTIDIVNGDSIILINNTLENLSPTGRAIDIQNALNVKINNNNFLGMIDYSVSINLTQDRVIDGRYNFWGSETTAEMDLKGAAANIDKIWDFYDNPLYGRVDYAEWLSAPNPDAYPWMGETPVNQSPVAKAGFDQVVFNEVILDGRGSYDPDGSIVSYYWTLQHRTDSANDKDAGGDNPTVSNLSSGFYDVCLTVTDDGEAIGIDCLLLAAAGSCFCTPSTFHIEMIEPDLLKADKGEKHGQALVKVLDDCGNAVSGVTVYGTFSGDLSESINGQTGGDGNVLLTTTTSSKSKPGFTFCVDDVINGTLSYAPADNVETCDSYQ